MGIDSKQLPMVFVSGDAKPPRPAYGKGLESLMLSSMFGVILDKIANGYKQLPGPGNRIVRTHTPFDFFGIHLATRRMIALDAKEGRETCRLDTNDTVFAEHQRLSLIRYGEAGAISGIVAESISNRKLYFLPWWRLSPRPKSVKWADMPEVGANSFIINEERWGKIIAANDARPVHGQGGAR